MGKGSGGHLGGPNNVRVGAAASIALAVLAVMLAAGCGPGNFDTEADELRKRNLELYDQVRTLERDIEQYIQETKTLRQRVVEEHSGIKGADPPRLTEIRFGRYSSALDTNDDGNDDLIRLYVLTLDQHGRFMPVAAVATVKAVRSEPDQDPQVIVEKQYGAKEFDARYRSGFTGTHYTLDVELPAPMPKGVNEADVSLFVKDAATGVTRRHSQTMIIETATAAATVNTEPNP